MFKFILLLAILITWNLNTSAQELDDTIKEISSEVDELTELENDSSFNTEESDELDELDDETNDEELLSDADKLKNQKDFDNENFENDFPEIKTSGNRKNTAKKRKRTYKPVYNKNVLIPSELHNPDKKLHRKNRRIKHPLAKKGLYKITKDLDYLYEIKPSEQSKAASLRFGIFEPTNLQSNNGNISFSELYDSDGTTLLFDFEWQKKYLGIIALKIGSGVFYAEGNGKFANPSETRPPKEEFTLLMFPNNISGVYKMKIWDNQWLVPYVDAGLDIFSILELRDDDQGPKIGASYGAHVAVGGAFSLSFMDKWTAGLLDREYGVNGLWLTAEFRNYIHLSGDFDFSGNFINGGFAVDF